MALSDRQLKFFRALLAPFPAECYGTIPRGGRSLTYLKPRPIQNRLDEVCGPMGWTTEYTASERGQKCRLKILCPDHTEDGWAWHYKEDGSGEGAMEDADDSEKSSYTNAFKRAAGIWGFGRELYGQGVPSWIADLHAYAPPPRGAISSDHRGGPSYAAPQGDGAQPPRGQRGQDFSPPVRVGKAMYAWMKQMEERYQADGRLKGPVSDFLKQQGLPWRTDELDEGGLRLLGRECVRVIKGWPEYDGIFDALPQASPHAAAAGDDLGNIKRAIMAAASAWVEKQLGRKPELSEVVAAIGELAASCLTGSGHKGEVLSSLRECRDKAWLINILQECQKQITRAAYTAAEVGARSPGVVVEDDVPF